jgi:protein involved in polysaccharide export with SLBB domain
LSNSAISVTVGGDFPITGSFPAFINERVDQFVTRMYINAREKALANITDPDLLKQINEKLNHYSLRDITLKRSSGETIKIDLLKFRINGDFKNNPYLKNDDVLIFPAADLERNFFSISGAVNKPGKFYFVDGDKLSDALELAQGINKAYENVTKAEIDRLDYNGDKLTAKIVDINADVSLQRGDRIIILADETQKKDFSVIVAGEVNRPGKIPITKDATTLKDVIKKAGGFTVDASLNRSRLFTGKSIMPILEKQFGINFLENGKLDSKELEQKYFDFENYLMIRMSNITEQDSAYFYLENQLRLTADGGSIDFTKLNDDNSEASKYIVKDNDVIIIPQKEKVVYVFGQVAEPGRINFVEGKDYTYYINEAGGFGEYADDDVMLIKSVSKNWISVSSDNAKIEEGDYIYIPKNPKRSFHYYLGETANYLGIIGSIATIILLLIQINK